VPSFTLTIQVPEPDAELRSAELFDDGAQGVEVRDASTTPMPGLPRPDPGAALLVAFFGGREEAEAARSRHGGELAIVPDEDWSETWKAGFHAFTVGPVFVRPSWSDAPRPADAVELVLDPGMAFGTGTHPTTALCLAALAELVRARPGARVLDVGTGSGLLALAAVKLGASRVVASDNDLVALAVARENADRNGVSVELTGDPPSGIRGEFDVVVANILANTLVALAPELAPRVAPGGTLLLSGILAGQEDEVRGAYLAQGLRRADDRSDGEWRLVSLRRAG
jgi:ribosomal protein L11 methyltransferase